jgi:hypothetical protein
MHPGMPDGSFGREGIRFFERAEEQRNDRADISEKNGRTSRLIQSPFSPWVNEDPSN